MRTKVLKRGALVRKGARASPFRAPLIGEVPIKIAQRENCSFKLDKRLSL